MMASTDAPPTACRWRILATVIVVESVGGLMYAFGIYSARLKSKFSLSQEQLDAISISSSLGSNVGVHWGLLTDAAGPSAALCAALVAGGGGWLLLWSALGALSGCGAALGVPLRVRAAPGHGHPALRLYVLLIAGAYVGACAVGAARLRAGDILAAGARERPEDDAPRLASILAVGLAVFYLALQLANAFAPVPAAGRYATGACAVLALVGGVIAKAAGIATRGATVLVALLSISNCLCRVAAGYASDRTAARGVPRSALLAAVSVAMAGAHLLGLPASKGSVYVLSVLSGGAYGAVATVHPLVAADRFGVAHLGAIYASITTANGLGSYLGSNVLAARLYDAANAPGHQVCESAAALCCVVLARREARRRTAGREEAGARVEARRPQLPAVAPPAARRPALASDDESDAGRAGDGGLDDDATDDASDA
ncbi:hypothetical protein JL722_13203 [Aureococcus anophagefferens]|nr:hypothetical protein JL722_13203 [Aureococcus anophagefferens]